MTEQDKIIDIIYSYKLNYCLGSAIDYLLGVQEDDDTQEKIEGLEQVIWYVQKEIQRLKDKSKQEETVVQKVNKLTTEQLQDELRKSMEAQKEAWFKSLGVPVIGNVKMPEVKPIELCNVDLELVTAAYPINEKVDSLPYCKDCDNHFKVNCKLGNSKFQLSCPTCNGGKFDKSKFEPCCECGEDYPAIDLVRDGHIYCPKCREVEARREVEKKAKKEIPPTCPDCKGTKTLTYYTGTGEDYQLLCPSCVEDNHPWKASGWCRCNSSVPASPGDNDHYPRCRLCGGLRKKVKTHE